MQSLDCIPTHVMLLKVRLAEVRQHQVCCSSMQEILPRCLSSCNPQAFVKGIKKCTGMKH